MERRVVQASTASGVGGRRESLTTSPASLPPPFAPISRGRWPKRNGNIDIFSRSIPIMPKRKAVLAPCSWRRARPARRLLSLNAQSALNPDLFEAFGNLAQAYLATGQDVNAVQAAYRALELRETSLGKTLFARCARNAVFRSDKDSRARQLMLRALLEDWAPPAHAYPRIPQSHQTWRRHQRLHRAGQFGLADAAAGCRIARSAGDGGTVGRSAASGLAGTRAHHRNRHRTSLDQRALRPC